MSTIRNMAAGIAESIKTFALCVILEQGRKSRVLLSLRNWEGWMSSKDVSRVAEIRFVFVTLAFLEGEGLVECQTADEPKDAVRGYLPRHRYRLTDSGRAMVETTEQAGNPGGSR